MLVAGASMVVFVTVHTRSHVENYEVIVPVQVMGAPAYYPDLGEWQHQVRPETTFRKEPRSVKIKHIGWPMVYNQTQQPDSFERRGIRWVRLAFNVILAVSMTIAMLFLISWFRKPRQPTHKIE